jgi:regulator of RNase E activity RraA
VSLTSHKVSDALLKLQKPSPREVARAGHLADLIPFAHLSSYPAAAKIIAPASTLKLIPKHLVASTTLPGPDHEIPNGSHWVDLTEPGTIMVIEQPEGQKCAAVGGIMALRMRVRGVQGVVVGGRVRDLGELSETGLAVSFPPRPVKTTSCHRRRCDLPFILSHRAPWCRIHHCHLSQPIISLSWEQ